MEVLADPTSTDAASLIAAGRHPVSALFDGLRQVVVATLRLVAAIVRFSSVTIPSTVYAVLHYSFTLQLNFPSLFFLFISSIVAGFIWLRYRHLNRYERLREEPLIKDEGFNLNPDVQRGGEENERGNFHNYLDEFLQAIRIFGFLEKPVFHELARHLQTRRLVAGDSISLDNDSSFYIVVDGNVQVFAPLPRTAYADMDNEQFEDEEHSGFQLLNEVQSGGTLSSLFTILRLFTEDVRLVVGQEDNGQEESRQHYPSALTGPSLESLAAPNAVYNAARRSSRGPRPQTEEAHSSSLAATSGAGGHSLRPGSSQLQLNAATLRNIPSAVASSPGLERGLDDFFTEIRRSKAASTVTDDATTVHQDEGMGMHGFQSAEEMLQAHPAANDLLPPAQAAAPFGGVFPHKDAAQAQAPAGSLSPPLLRGRVSVATTDSGRPTTPGSILSSYSGTGAAIGGAGATSGGGAYGYNSAGGPSSSRSRKMSDEHGDTQHGQGLGTIGRATVDTTLAVIPAVAFKRLTRRYPNAAAHIVQVILTRLSRVTFHTAHVYLGLTKEVMRTEKHINQLACYPLPSSFYEKGGMEKLRQRFLPEPLKQRTQDSPNEGEEANDSFFTQRHHQDRTVSGSEHTIRNRPRRQSSIVMDGSPMRAHTARGDSVPQTPWGHPDLPVRTPMARTSVGPGDLFSMTGTTDTGGSLQNRPGSPLTDAGLGLPKGSGGMQRGSIGSFVIDSTRRTKERTASSGSRIGADFFSGARREPSLGDAVLNGDTDPRQNEALDLRDEVMNCIAKSIGLAQAAPSPVASMHASPFLQPQDNLQRNMFKSAFGTLSMLDAAMYDDESSMTGHSSNLANLHHFDALENEIDIRFFEAGSTLARSGERQAGLFYVVDGFLDIVVPPTDEENDEVRNLGTSAPGASAQAAQKPARSGGSRRRSSSKSGGRDKQATGRHAPTTSSAVGNALDGTRDGRRPSIVRAERTSKGAQEVAEAAALLMKVRGGRALYTVGRGGIAGYLSSLLSSASYVDIRAKTDVYVGFLPAHALARMMERRPIVMLTLCKRLLSLLSPLILHIDSALDWQQVNAGQVIYREGDPADSFYIVINGRLRSIAERGGGSSGVDVLSEHGQGDSVGELDVITRSRRRKTLHAIRDSELAKMPMTLFNAISVRHPSITIQISRIIAKRVRDEVSDRQRDAASSARRSPIVPRGLPDLGSNNKNLKTVAIVPVTRHVPVVGFSNRLQQAFDDTIGGGTVFLNQSSVMSVLGRHAFNRMGKLKLAGWLAEQEQKYRLVLYVVDTAVSSSWTQTSIRQADCILLVGFGDDPTMGEYERLLLGIKTTARKELVLLHPERSVPPGSTREWLKSRPWINAHHHVELPGVSHPSRSTTFTSQLPFGNDPTAVKALRNLKAKLETSLMRYRRNAAQNPGAGRSHQSSDFARLARRLCGRSIGVVLGGGGARGCAHVGFLRALEERGIPVDMVGGTSIGSLVGGLYAKEGEMVSSFGRVKKFAGRMASLWRFVLDLTYPVVSYTSGFEFNRGVFKALGETHIEDMWLPFFCNTTNITWSRMEVHTSGYSWRYIRASMTLAGLIPPLVDEGNMLVDGGYLSNLPVSVMLAMGARDVFAVDVGAIDDTSPRYYGDTLSGWWVALNRYNPWSDARNIPSIPDIQGRLTYASSVQDLEEAKRTPNCRYLRMPVEMFGTMEFGKFTEIAEIGYEAARKSLDQWARDGQLPTIYDTESKQEALRRRQRGGVSARRNSV